MMRLPLTVATARLRAVVLLLDDCATVGCGSSQRPSGADSDWMEVRFTSAALRAERASGEPWHQTAPDHSTAVLAELIGLAAGYPEVGALLGSALASEPEPFAPEPFVVLKIGGDSFAISPVGRTLSPEWSQPIALSSRRYARDAVALIQVKDAVNGAVIGQREVPVRELLTPGGHVLQDIEEVRTLDFHTRPMPRRPSMTVESYVDARYGLDELVEGRDSRWTAIPVWNGDRITIAARGMVCPSRPEPCFGPDGVTPEVEREEGWRGYNHEAFKEEPHASLVAVMPGDAFFVGAASARVAEQSGFLLLFVNDTDRGNNEGGFDVAVTIEPAP